MRKKRGCVKSYLKEVNDDGFSLIELVVAVGILAILSVVGVVAYSKITENARVAAVNAAAAEVYKGAVAYDSNGDANAAEMVEQEWMDSSKKDKDGKASITVSVSEPSPGAFCVVAEMTERPDITASKGSGCDNTGNGSENGNETEENNSPATAAECFEAHAGNIQYYNIENTECGSDVVIPETLNGEAVVSVGAYVFEDAQLMSVVIPDSVKAIHRGAFRGNELTSVVIPNGVESIGDYSFMNNQLTEIVIPSSVKTIGDYAFYDNKLTSVEFNDGLETIGKGAFEDNALTSVVIPDSVEIIGNDAFSNNQLTSVRVSENTMIEAGAFDNPEIITRY